MGLTAWIVKKGLQSLATADRSGRRRKTGGNLNAAWETAFGASANAEADELWGELTEEQRVRAYKNHALVYACIRKISDAFKEANVELGAENADGEWEKVENHEALRVIERPNPELSWSQFSDYRWAHRLTAGKAFVWKWRDARGMVSEIWPIPPHWVTVVPLKDVRQGDKRRFVKEFKVSVPGGQRYTIESPDMIYERYVDPMNFTDAIGPMQACFRDYRLDGEKDNYILEMLTNVSIPGLVVKQEEEFDPEQMTELRAILAERVGYGKRGSPMFLSGENAGVEAMAPLKDLDWPGLSALNESHICAAFGVPPLLVHARVAQENSPLSSPNLGAAEKVFYRGTMMGVWDTSGQGLTQGLLRSEGVTDLRFRHNTSKVQALQSDLKEMADIVEKARDYLDFNEVRALLGREPDPAMDNVYLRQLGVAEIREGESGETAADAEEQDKGWDEV